MYPLFGLSGLGDSIEFLVIFIAKAAFVVTAAVAGIGLFVRSRFLCVTTLIVGLALTVLYLPWLQIAFTPLDQFARDADILQDWRQFFRIWVIAMIFVVSCISYTAFIRNPK